jgi:hypothetical protein
MFPRIKNILLAHKIVAFQSALATAFITSSIVKVLDWKAGPQILEQIVGFKATVAFIVGYFVAGLAMLVGVGWRKDIEAFGLITVVASILVQLVILTTRMGFNLQAVNGLVFWGLFIGACFARLHSIFSGNVVVELKGGIN